MHDSNNHSVYHGIGRPQYTPNAIASLKPDEVFVFGSNLQGRHGGGAARVAVDKFGALWGQGVGLQGQSYAIPTMQGGLETIQPYVDQFIAFAEEHEELFFYVTRIGCGIAGFKDEEMATLFDAALELDNVCLPESFAKILEEQRRNKPQEAFPGISRTASVRLYQQGQVRTLADIAITLVTLYELRTNWIANKDLPSKHTLFEHYSQYHRGLAALGYQAPFGQNTFSVNGHDMGVSSYIRRRMKEGAPYKGFGISAQSMNRKGVSYNVGKNGLHHTLLNYRSFEEEYTYQLPENEIAAKYVAIAAYSGAFSISVLSSLLKQDASQTYREQLDFCFGKGFLRQKGDQIQITEKGFEHYGAVFSLFSNRIPNVD